MGLVWQSHFEAQWIHIYILIMANFDVHFLDSDDDLSLLTQEDRSNERNINDVPIDMEDLMYSNSAICSLVSVSGEESDSDENSERICVAECYKPITEDISDSDG